MPVLVTVLACTAIGWLIGHPLPGLLVGIALVLLAQGASLAY